MTPSEASLSFKESSTSACPGWTKIKKKKKKAARNELVGPIPSVSGYLKSTGSPMTRKIGKPTILPGTVVR